MILQHKSRVVITTAAEILELLGIDCDYVGASLVDADGYQSFDAENTVLVFTIPENRPALALVA